MAQAINHKHCKLSLDWYITILEAYQSPFTLICYTRCFFGGFSYLTFVYSSIKRNENVVCSQFIKREDTFGAIELGIKVALE